MNNVLDNCAFHESLHLMRHAIYAGTPRRSSDITETVRQSETIRIGEALHNALYRCDYIPTGDDVVPDEDQLLIQSGTDGDIQLFSELDEHGNITYALQIEEDEVKPTGLQDAATIGMTRQQVIALALGLLEAIGIEAKGVSF